MDQDGHQSTGELVSDVQNKDLACIARYDSVMCGIPFLDKLMTLLIPT